MASWEDEDRWVGHWRWVKPEHVVGGGMATENVSRRERLDQVAREAVEAWSKNPHDQRRLRETIIEAVAATVDAEYQPLLKTVEEVIEDLWHVDQNGPARRLERALRATREES